MIRQVWSVLCNNVFTDVETEDVALTVLESIAIGDAADPPTSIQRQFELITLWYSDVGSVGFSYKVKVTGPTGRILAEVEVPAAAFAPPKHRVKTRLRFPGLVFDGAGTYWFCVMRLVDGQEVLDAEVPLALSVA
jgi:hypothetical protein